MNEWSEKAITQLRKRLNEERKLRASAEAGQSLMTVLAVIGWAAFITALCLVPAAQADEGNNWASEWVDGYVVGYCWRKEECDLDSMDPVRIPYPEGDEDGYTRGLREGLAAGRVEI